MAPALAATMRYAVFRVVLLPLAVFLAILLPLCDAAHQRLNAQNLTAKPVTLSQISSPSSHGSNHTGRRLLAPRANHSTGGKDKSPRVFIGILSAPGNFQRRDMGRNLWLNKLKASKEARAGRVVVKFMIGRASGKTVSLGAEGHLQGRVASTEDKDVEWRLIEESRTNNDIYRLPHTDIYEALPTKVLLTLQAGLAAKADFVVKLDDDQELFFEQLLPFLTIENARGYMYGGSFLWDRKLYDSQKGADGSFKKYFAGPGYVLSAPLARQIAQTHLSHSVAYDLYGSSSEDVDMGRWVAFEDKKLQDRNNTHVVYHTFPFHNAF